MFAEHADVHLWRCFHQNAARDRHNLRTPTAQNLLTIHRLGAYNGCVYKFHSAKAITETVDTFRTSQRAGDGVSPVQVAGSRISLPSRGIRNERQMSFGGDRDRPARYADAAGVRSDACPPLRDAICGAFMSKGSKYVVTGG